MCEKCGSKTHRDDVMNRRCDGCEYKVRHCVCTPREKDMGYNETPTKGL